MLAGKIESRGLVDRVVHRIGRNIVSGQIKPADTLQTNRRFATNWA